MGGFADLDPGLGGETIFRLNADYVVSKEISLDDLPSHKGRCFQYDFEGLPLLVISWGQQESPVLAFFVGYDGPLVESDAFSPRLWYSDQESSIWRSLKFP